jgi:transposase
VNPLKAKRRIGGRNKTDPIDARGLAILLRNGTLPEVWVPPGQLGNLRGLMRTRLALRSHATCVKNRIHTAIRRYGTLDGEPVKRSIREKEPPSSFGGDRADAGGDPAGDSARY